MVDYPFTGTFVPGPPPWYTEYVTLSSGAGTQPAKYVRILPYGSHKIEYDANGHGEDPVTRYVKDGETAAASIVFGTNSKIKDIKVRYNSGLWK